MSENSITRRQFITTAGAAALSLPFLRAGGALAADGRPNFVFILTDHQRHDATVIFFAGDNGYFQGEHNLLDKRAMYEESIRIPLVMRYPKLVRPGSLIDQMVLNIDICPTLLDIAGERSPEGVQGRSLVPLLSGKTRGWRSDFLYEYFEETPYATPTIKGVRTQRWKYIEYPEVQETAELYDLATDPDELHNLIGDPSRAKVLADMRARLERLEKETE